MRKSVNKESIERAIAQETASSGPLSQSQLAKRLNLSQATLSRVLSRMPRAVRLGRGRASRFAVRREVLGVDESLPVYRISPEAELIADGELIPLFDKGFAWIRPDGRADHFDGWPYALEPLRPSGYLGRHIPRAHPELDFPARLEDWNDDDVLRYASRLGWNMPGDRLVGDTPQHSFLRSVGVQHPAPSIERETQFRNHVDGSLSEGLGSSAGGEQPKFLTVVDQRAMIVKFSPSLEGEGPIARRWADLLVCEHLAFETLNAAGITSSKSEIVVDESRFYLQVERFDRIGRHGRRGVLSLRVLQAEFGESRDTSWLGVARDLERQGRAPPSVAEHIRLQQTFGRLIGNTDMHLENASVFLDGTSIVGPTPVYDMLPMKWAPTSNELRPRALEPAPPRSFEMPVFFECLRLANEFWSKVRNDPRVSEEFRTVAGESEESLRQLQALTRHLPVD
ncbi:MAG: HipA domain-containing protein [Myxococcota bacterium]